MRRFVAICVCEVVGLLKEPCRSTQWPPYYFQDDEVIGPCCYMRRHSAGLYLKSLVVARNGLCMFFNGS